VVQRGASNVYFPHVVSSIYLPLWAETATGGVVKALEDPRVWGPLSSGLVDGKVSADRCEMVASMRSLDPKELYAAAQRKLEGIPEPSTLIAQTEEAFRRSEYDALKAGRGAPQSDLLVQAAPLSLYKPPVSTSLSHLALVHKLRETRALAGFTRILPPDGSLTSPRLQKLSLDQRIDWLPAMIVRGEGIFVEFDSGRMDTWVRRTRLIAERISPLSGRYNQRRTEQGQPPPACITGIRASAHIRSRGHQSTCLRMRVRKCLPARASLLRSGRPGQPDVRGSHLHGVRRLRRVHGGACPPGRSGTFREHHSECDSEGRLVFFRSGVHREQRPGCRKL
jgi:hypothetical protein